MPLPIYRYDPKTSSLLIGHDAFGAEVWKEFTLWVNEGDGTVRSRRLSHGLEHLLDGHNLSKLELGIEPAVGNSAAALGLITAPATNDDATNAATATNATTSSATSAVNESKEQQEQQERARLTKDIAAAAKANALYASLLSTGVLLPLSHIRQLTDYLAILLFETRPLPTHQLAAEAEAAHDAYTRIFAAAKVPPIAVLVAAKKEMMEKGSVDVEATDAVNDWASGAAITADEDEEATALEKDVVRARLRAVLQDCLEMLNTGDAKRNKRKRNRKNKKAAKQVEGEKASVVEEEAAQGA